MKCHVESCNSSDDRYLWKCLGCYLHFHAACVGVQRNCEEEILQFMAPICKSCSNQLREQLKLQAAIEAQTQLSHKTQSLLGSFSETMDSLDSSLMDLNVNGQIKLLQNQFNDFEKNHRSTTTNLVQEIATFKASYDMDGLKSELIEQQQNCYRQLELDITPMLQSIAIEIEALRATAVQSDLTQAILEELKSLDDKLTNTPPVVSREENVVSLADEISKSNQPLEKLSTGWRWLGSKKVYKPQKQWDEYDARMKVRAEQLKDAEKARRRRRNHRRQLTRHTKTTDKRPYTISVQSTLPSDKELLAAAKHTFSGNSTQCPDPKFIPFRRGETLNPYPPTRSSATTTTPSLSLQISPAAAPTSSFAAPCNAYSGCHIHPMPATPCRPAPVTCVHALTNFQHSRRAPNQV